MKLARPHADVLLLTAELDAALSVWRDWLGFSCVREDAYRAVVQLGTQSIRLFEPHPTPPRNPGGLYAGTGYRVLALLLDDLDVACGRFADAGRRVADAPALPGRWPIRFARDADGNMLELIGLPGDEPHAPVERLQIGATVADSARTRQFYTELLGLPEQPRVPMGDGMTRHAVSAGRTTVKFWSRNEPLPRLSGAPGAALGIRAICLRVDGLDETLGELGTRGVATSQASRLPEDPRVRWIQDPDGNWIELRGTD
jgi:catechol 2,3-dioxygenase-like lactoylglutathione lyase family enzyme